MLTTGTILVKSLLHVVVGAGLPGYFLNALRSVLLVATEDVLTIYNSISPDDKPDLAALRDEFPGRIVGSILGDNEGHPKVGALYSAYNRGLAFADGRYTYVSFMQGDQQMMYWPTDVVLQLGHRFRWVGNAGERVFAVTSSMRCLGAFGIEAAQSSLGPPLDEPVRSGRFRQSRAVSDVAIYSLRLCRQEKFSFEGDEGSLSRVMVARGFGMTQLDQSCLAFLPWPATVRRGRRRGREVVAPDGTLLLRIRGIGGPRIGGLPEGQREWQEHGVVPNFYRTLYPYWPTDIIRPKWIWRRRSLTRSLGISFFAGIDPDGRVSSFLTGSRFRRSPSLLNVLVAILFGVLMELRELVVRNFRYGVKRLSTPTSTSGS